MLSQLLLCLFVILNYYFYRNTLWLKFPYSKLQHYCSNKRISLGKYFYWFYLIIDIVVSRHDCDIFSEILWIPYLTKRQTHFLFELFILTVYTNKYYKMILVFLTSFTCKWDVNIIWLRLLFTLLYPFFYILSIMYYDS